MYIFKLEKKCDYFVGFEMFKTIFQEKKSNLQYVLLLVQRYGFISDTVTGKFSKKTNKQKNRLLQIICQTLMQQISISSRTPP